MPTSNWVMFGCADRGKEFLSMSETKAIELTVIVERNFNQHLGRNKDRTNFIQLVKLKL